MKKKVLLTSILTIALCLSLIVGSTFALFTSESKVNVAVTSGNVKVVATVGTLKLSSMGVEMTGDTFANGGTAAYDAATGKITLDRVTPGDKVEFAITVTNESDVTIKYRVKWEVSGELAAALKATADGSELVSGYSKWSTWNVTDATTKEIAIVVELPKEVGNDYQDKNADIVFTVEAIQGNAETFDEVYTNTTVETENNVTKEEVKLSSNGFTATIYEGTTLNDGATTATLTVTKEEANTGNVNFEAVGTEAIGLNISISEVAAGNTTPIKITFEGVLAANLSGVAIYHKGTLMTAVGSETDVDADGEFFYDATTGNVTLATKNFSNFTLVPNTVTVGDEDALKAAIDKGNNVILTDGIALTDTLLIKKPVVIDLNGYTVDANLPSYKYDLFQTSSDTDPDVVITSSESGAVIDAGDKGVILSYGSTEISNVEINVGTVKSSNVAPFNVPGSLTLGEGTVVNVEYLGTSLITGGPVAVVIDGAEINIDTYKTWGGAVISCNVATVLDVKNSAINIGLDTTYTSYFISRADHTTIENCTFNIVGVIEDLNKDIIYDIVYQPDDAVGPKYAWVSIDD